MKRLTDYWFSRVIERAFELVPEHLHDRLRHVDFFCGADPVFAGLHSTENLDDDVDYATWRISYRTNWHTCYTYHTSDKSTTIVMPKRYKLCYGGFYNVEVSSAVHELGHVLDEQEDFRRHIIPVTPYAKVCRAEAVAEAFAVALCPETFPSWCWQALVNSETATRELREFMGLAPSHLDVVQYSRRDPTTGQRIK